MKKKMPRTGGLKDNSGRLLSHDQDSAIIGPIPAVGEANRRAVVEIFPAVAVM
jgi:hypothetical protein